MKTKILITAFLHYFPLFLWSYVPPDNIFNDPGYTGTTQYSEWDRFTHASGTGNTPDVAGHNGLITQSNSPAILTSSKNIYSLSSDLSYSLTASSEKNLRLISLQVRFLGQANALSDVKLLLDGGSTELSPTIDNIYSVEFEETFGDAVDLGYALTWDLTGFDVTAYEIVFDTLVHTSLDQARLDTQAVAQTKLSHAYFNSSNTINDTDWLQVDDFFDWVNLTHFPWVYHLNLGWLYASGENYTDNAWFWDTKLGWLWTNEFIFPWLWSDNLNTWIYYFNDDKLWFYNAETKLWFQPLVMDF